MATKSTALAPVEDEHQLPAQSGISLGGGVVASLPEIMQLAEVMAGATTLPQSYRKPADIMAAALTAAQLRLPLMTVINGTHMINGKVTLSADLMAGVARGSGEVESWQEEEIKDGYRASATRKGGTSLMVTFTLADAKSAGLEGGNWKKFPGDMCRARAISRLCRRLFPDILAGMYSPDEMEDAAARQAPTPRRVDSDPGVIDAEFEPADDTPTRTHPDTVKRLRAMMASVDQATCADEVQQRRRELGQAVEDAMASGRLVKGGSTHTDAVQCLADGLRRQREMRVDEKRQNGPDPWAEPDTADDGDAAPSDREA